MELIAHRAANLPETVAPAAAVADIVEIDLHIFRGRLDVRHAKVIWPLEVYWEKWRLLPGLTPPSFSAVLDATPHDAHLWLDLKGFTARLARSVLAEIGDRRPMTASSRNWWTLKPMRQATGVRTFRSVGSRWQLWLALRFGAGGDGIVMHERFAEPATVARLLELTPDVVVWAVPDLARAVELAAMDVTGVIVDDLDLIRAISQRLGRTDPPRGSRPEDGGFGQDTGRP